MVPTEFSTAQIFAMLGNETLWDAARLCHDVLSGAGVPHAVRGGVAVCLHGYQRNTTDVDLLIRPGDAASVKAVLTEAGFVWNAAQHEFRSPAGVAIQCILTGDKAGANSPVELPDPADAQAVTTLEGLPVLSLAKLIETKLACGQGSLRRTHKDFADVVELIARHGLSRSFARSVHKSLRPAFRELVLHARGE